VAGSSGELADIRAFFAPRAAGWDEKFPDDGPAFAAAVEALDPPAGGIALDAGCGTGRALPALRRAVGPAGTVIGLDITPEMLTEAGRRDRRSVASLVLGDVCRLPLPDGCVDAILGAGLLPHLGQAPAGLAELARVTRPQGRLALFHPIGRVALAARHGGRPDPDDVRAERNIRKLLTEAGWRVEMVDDAADRYLVIGTNREKRPQGAAPL
jgi:SAM-dependent methyltransferase